MQQQPLVAHGLEVENDPAAPPLSTYEAASGLARWAISKGLVHALPPDVDRAYLADIPMIPLPHEAEVILRQRGVESIAYNAPSRMIYVYTKRKVTQKELKSLPSSLRRHGISFPQGAIDDVGKGEISSQGAFYSVHVSPAGRHYACGSSISPGNDPSAGTLGALVTLADGTIHGLTNNHVSALCSHVELATPILAPGVIDVRANGIDPFLSLIHI